MLCTWVQSDYSQDNAWTLRQLSDYKINSYLQESAETSN